jgi:hypothetical protein
VKPSEIVELPRFHIYRLRTLDSVEPQSQMIHRIPVELDLFSQPRHLNLILKWTDVEVHTSMIDEATGNVTIVYARRESTNRVPMRSTVHKATHPSDELALDVRNGRRRQWRYHSQARGRIAREGRW